MNAVLNVIMRSKVYIIMHSFKQMAVSICLTGETLSIRGTGLSVQSADQSATLTVHMLKSTPLHTHSL